ncbi:MAG: tRNA lysidine(34) synthetase TilS [Bacteroidales bacterium]|nr:tRNA lysidine(34) synthetase TilS [Bacteroidales bacterium]
MIKEVYQILEKAQITKRTRILCAVSGGIDSTVMLHVMHELDMDCVVAHCNFHLRGDDSNLDEKFVKSLADRFEYKFVTQDFDTEKYAKQNGISIQMAARDLRYAFFYDSAEKNNCDYIALAHNADDQVETVLTNLIRGTGVRGLTGMSFVKNNLLRPLLWVSRDEIELFANENYIDYRTDITNAQTKYSRNKLRHKVIPLLEEINPAAKINILNSVKYLSDTELIMQEFVNAVYNKCIFFKEDLIIVELPELSKFPAVETILFEILIKLEIPKVLAVDAINLLNAQSGRFCEFLNIRILKDRDALIIDKKYSPKKTNIVIDDLDSLSKLEEIGFTIKAIDYKSGYQIIKDSQTACIDLDKIVFPITLRNWEDGDKFKPLGMENFKKISDFLTDVKLSVFEKEKVLIFESNGSVFWVAGLRIDDRFKISNSTKRVLELSSVQ